MQPPKASIPNNGTFAVGTFAWNIKILWNIFIRRPLNSGNKIANAYQ